MKSHRVERLVMERLEHAREQCLIMLEVAVHDCDVRRSRAEHALDRRTRKAPTAYPQNALRRLEPTSS